jgi:alpha-D-ribose 1-methylphosphonate 5-triphosphate synthase subunit PhnL
VIDCVYCSILLINLRVRNGDFYEVRTVFDFDKNIMGYTSRFERVILRAGAMLIFSVLFQF